MASNRRCDIQSSYRRATNRLKGQMVDLFGFPNCAGAQGKTVFNYETISAKLS